MAWQHCLEYINWTVRKIVEFQLGVPSLSPPFPSPPKKTKRAGLLRLLGVYVVEVLHSCFLPLPIETC